MSKARIGVILLIILTFSITVDAEEERCSGKGCHAGIETPSQSMAFISCTGCHYGSGNASVKEEAHSGEFYRNPSSLWIIERTCGKCHAPHVDKVKKSLMATTAGIISGTEWAWAAKDTRNGTHGVYGVEDLDGDAPTAGSEEYKKYMAERGWAIKKLEGIPTYNETRNPAYDYLRKECLRCHLWTEGTKRLGDYRASGCAACHVPYNDEGLYKGNDSAINKTIAGKMERHIITNTPESRQCDSCHNRGKRIGKSYQGLMEDTYGSPFNEKGELQKPLHGKRYLYVKEDLHYERGLECMDCHTSIDMHGDGNIYDTTLKQVEIECEDCHGTPDKYPWEINGIKDDFLLTERGNIRKNVKKAGDGAVLISKYTGKEHNVPLLKKIKNENSWKTEAGKVAMASIPQHIEKNECYACHSSWAPQCYGCHVKFDYSKNKTSVDWIASGLTARNTGIEKSLKTLGAIEESRTYLRWEEPILGVNNEGRVAPFVPGCQVFATLINESGKTEFSNRVYFTAEGTPGIALNPLNPHTTTSKARTCESCHSNPKSLGYGIEGGLFLNMSLQPYGKEAKDGLKDFPYDLSQFVTRDGKILQTSSREGSRPLSNEERAKMERVNMCIGCHRDYSDPIWNEVRSSVGLAITEKEHEEALNKALHAISGGKEPIPSSILGGAMLIIGSVLLILMVHEIFRKRRQ